MKKFLHDLIERKETQIAEIRTQIETSKSLEEVRSLGSQIEALNGEITELRTQLSALDEPQGDTKTFGSFTQGQTGEQREEMTESTLEYRNAFMEYVCRGTEIPQELRANAVTTTANASAVIPSTILEEIVSELSSYGGLYNLVRKLNVQGGVSIPILDLKPTATWITANKGASESDDQKIQANTSITFNYYGLECKVAQTLLVNVTVLDMFENLFTTLATEAIVKALEIGIVKGTGTGQMTGITVDTRVPAGNKITIVPADFTSWEGWKKKVFAKMKKSYRNGIFLMAQSTFDAYIDGMVDKNGQPIGRVNYGIDGGETYRFGGKTVMTVEDDVISAYDDASTGDVVAIFINPTDYAINSNMSLSVVKWTDNDTNTIKNKAILICDGKLVDANGVLIIKKGAAA